MMLVERFLESDIVAVGTVGYDGFEHNVSRFGLFNELRQFSVCQEKPKWSIMRQLQNFGKYTSLLSWNCEGKTKPAYSGLCSVMVTTGYDRHLRIGNSIDEAIDLIDASREKS